MERKKVMKKQRRDKKKIDEKVNLCSRRGLKSDMPNRTLSGFKYAFLFWFVRYRVGMIWTFIIIIIEAMGRMR
jgi:hypothetical protein